MLNVQNLCKTIDKKPFLTELTFQVASGELLFLLGGNGSGKTILLNILATLVEPTSGTVSISGTEAFSNLKHVRPHIGFIPTNFDGYTELTVIDYLSFFAAVYKLEKQERTASIDAVLELMDLNHLRHTKIENMSSGERQRLLFAKTFMHEPQLWILDEPLARLDPRAQLEMVELLSELKVLGKTIVIATNQLEDLQKFCDNRSETLPNTNLIGILKDGKFVVFNSIGKLQKKFEDNITDYPNWNWLVELYLEVTKS